MSHPTPANPPATMRGKESVEWRLYESFRQHKGIRLSAEEVQDLINLDDAIQTRTNHETLSLQIV